MTTDNTHTTMKIRCGNCNNFVPYVSTNDGNSVSRGFCKWFKRDKDSTLKCRIFAEKENATCKQPEMFGWHNRMETRQDTPENGATVWCFLYDGMHCLMTYRNGIWHANGEHRQIDENTGCLGVVAWTYLPTIDPEQFFLGNFFSEKFNI